ncbi:MAG: Uncharacterised protein [Cryomorphaceae bacterium]|nr:MAG: Uncharacterised protein [Cryomorphaceae bacterium]
MFKSLIYVILPLILSYHDFHVTHTTLHYNSDLDNMEITIKFAIQDLEISLDNTELRIGTLNEKKSSEEIIKNYFKNHLNIYGDNKIINYEWVGKEISDNLHDIYIYFEISNFNQNDKLKSLILENTIFIETTHNQSNIVLIEFEDNDYNLTFTKDLIRQKIQLIR